MNFLKLSVQCRKKPNFAEQIAEQTASRTAIPYARCVFINGRVHHYMKIASSTSHNCGISYFVFDDIASLAGSADARDVDPQILSDICKGSGMKIRIALNYVFLVQKLENVQKASLLFLG